MTSGGDRPTAAQNNPANISLTGGTSSGDFRTIHEFVKADGNLMFSAANNKIYGDIFGTTTLTVGTVYTATVGAGGTASSGATGGSGSSSTFTNIAAALGGGGGAAAPKFRVGGDQTLQKFIKTTCARVDSSEFDGIVGTIKELYKQYGLLTSKFFKCPNTVASTTLIPQIITNHKME